MSDFCHENSEGPPLSPVQTRAVVALAQGCSITAAAETAGVHRMTVHRWLKDQTFEAAVKQARDDYFETLGDEFKTLSGLAITRIRTLLESPQTPPGVVARVSFNILNRRYFPKAGWELAAMDPEVYPESQNEDHEDGDASPENTVTSDALRNNSPHEPD